MRKVEGITHTGINFVVLDSGVCVYLNEDEKLELFSSRLGSKQLKIVEDSILGGDMTLTKKSGQVMFYRGNKLYQMRMK